MTTLLITAAIALNVLAFALLIRHRRNVAHHRFTMGTIGRDPAMTEALHERLSGTAPLPDWRNPLVMRSKVNAWLRHNREQGGTEP